MRNSIIISVAGIGCYFIFLHFLNSELSYQQIQSGICWKNNLVRYVDMEANIGVEIT
jgi:hypothetical protein